MRKFLLVYITLLILTLSLSACNSPDQTYVFSNSLEQIERIELIYNHSEFGEGIDEKKFEIIKELNQAEIASFMETVYTLETKHGGPPPAWGYGRYIARVTYENGDIEMLGSINIEYIKADTISTGAGYYYFVGDAFVTLFSQYVDIELYPSN